MTIQEQLARLETAIKGIRRDVQGSEDYETADAVNRSVNHALELLLDVQLELEPAEELIAA
jgi:hypothetical protein